MVARGPLRTPPEPLRDPSGTHPGPTVGRTEGLRVLTKNSEFAVQQKQNVAMQQTQNVAVQQKHIAMQDI